MFHQFVWFIQITVFALFPAMIFYACPADWPCASSLFIYNPAGHVIAVDLNIINNTSLRDVFAKEPKFFYREPKSINWKHNFKILMDSVEDYARELAKR